MTEEAVQRRLFLALWPDEITRRQLAEVQHRFGQTARLKSAKRVPQANIHITAHFLGDVSADVATQLQTLLTDVRASACTLVIDRWGYFPRARVVWLGGAAPDALIDLVAQTQACIQACIAGYQQKRFVPHVTIFRKARHPLEVDAFEPIVWPIDRFVLVESVTRPQGAEYSLLNEWRLA